MRVHVLAVGRLKAGPTSDLAAHFLKRARDAGRGVGLTDVTLSELAEARQSAADQRKRDEGARLEAALEKLGGAGADMVRVVLDERGKAMTSQALADWTSQQRDNGCKALAFVLGGPDGHAEDLRAHARLQLSLGRLTLPHGLARIVLLEQLYRTATILAGHPYHRV